MASEECRKTGLLEKDFSRSGVLSLRIMLTLVLYMIADAGRRGYMALLDAFWDECDTLGIDLGTKEPVSAAAFCKARMKIPSDMILALVKHAAALFDLYFGHGFRVKGYRVFAVDGTKVQVTRSDELFDALGWHASGYNPQMLLSVLYNVVSKVPHDLRVAPTHASERDELRAMMGSLCQGDILVLDRGYPAFDLVTELMQQRTHFLIRLPSETFPAVKAFVEEGRRDGWVTISPPRRLLSTHGALRARVVVMPGVDLKPVVFLTDLEETEFSWAEIGELYHMRWEAEELYKLEKGKYLGQGQFHSKTLDGLKQEVYAFALFVSNCRFLTAGAAQLGGVPYRHVYQKTALLAVADYITRLFLEERSEDLRKLTVRLLDRIGRTVVVPRPGRSYPRRSYRPRLRWGPNGKKGGRT